MPKKRRNKKSNQEEEKTECFDAASKFTEKKKWSAKKAKEKKKYSTKKAKEKKKYSTQKAKEKDQKEARGSMIASKGGIGWTSEREQARKPRRYASPKLCPLTYPLTHLLTGVKCRATSVAKKNANCVYG